jgi:hypothetical protein
MNGIAYAVRAESYKEDKWSNQVNSARKSVKKTVSQKGANIQRKLEHGSR